MQLTAGDAKGHRDSWQSARRVKRREHKTYMFKWRKRQTPENDSQDCLCNFSGWLFRVRKCLETRLRVCFPSLRLRLRLASSRVSLSIANLSRDALSKPSKSERLVRLVINADHVTRETRFVILNKCHARFGGWETFVIKLSLWMQRYAMERPSEMRMQHYLLFEFFALRFSLSLL